MNKYQSFVIVLFVISQLSSVESTLVCNSTAYIAHYYDISDNTQTIVDICLDVMYGAQDSCLNNQFTYNSTSNLYSCI